MSYPYEKPTTCDYFDGVQVGDKIAVNLTDGSRFVGKVERASEYIVKLEMTTIYGGVRFTRTDERVKNVEVLERKIVPGLYLYLAGSVLYRVRDNGHVRAVAADGDGSWFDATATAQHVMDNFERIGE